MTPTGSWPRMSPGLTGYSPRTMCTSVPQIVVVVIRMIASPTPGVGFGTSSTAMRSLSLKTTAFIVLMTLGSCDRKHSTRRVFRLPLQPRAECDAQVVRPQHDREHALPKYQSEKAEREKPSSEPHCAHETVLLDSYAFHLRSFHSPRMQ